MNRYKTKTRAKMKFYRCSIECMRIYCKIKIAFQIRKVRMMNSSEPLLRRTIQLAKIHNFPHPEQTLL